MKTQVNLFSHNNYLSFMKSVVDDFKARKTGPQSLGEWAKRLGYRSSRSLGMILDGKRLPSIDFLDAFSRYMELKNKEKDYLLELVKVQKLVNKNKPVEENLNKLKRINPYINEFVEINTVKFSYIAKWYHLVLKEFLRGKNNYCEDYKELAYLLKNKVSISEIKSAINNLIDLGFITRTPNQTLHSKDIDLMTTNDIPSEAIKIHHEGMLELAKQALREQASDEREFQAFTFKMNPDQLSEAKEYLRDVIKEFNNRFCDQNEKNVYQLNMHIFSHTNNKGLPQ